ncbi:hypothetical protein BA065_00795 [Nanoarchaeota archaeon NZ13-N]|nr:MAG: hypothetical protein BA065_00795 [Nanoarchaeota archaeon NZ13-N]
MVDYFAYYSIIRSIPGQFKVIADLWGIRDPLIGPIIVMIVIFIFWYLIILLGVKGSFGRLGWVSENLQKYLAIIIAIILMFGIAPFAVLIFGNPFVALALLIIEILIYSRGKPKRVY